MSTNIASMHDSQAVLEKELEQMRHVMAGLLERSEEALHDQVSILVRLDDQWLIAYGRLGLRTT
jgi:tRNA G37 N-methylase Trm5